MTRPRARENPDRARSRHGCDQRLKETSGSGTAIGGAELAGQAIAAGLVDELHLLVKPILVRGGKRALPDDIGAQLELMDERRFRSGGVHLRYRL